MYGNGTLFYYIKYSTSITTTGTGVGRSSQLNANYLDLQSTVIKTYLLFWTHYLILSFLISRTREVF